MSDSQAWQVKQFVKSLERNDRYIVMLYYADGLTPMEISRVLDIPSTHVRERLLELRAQLSGITRQSAAPTTPFIGQNATGGSSGTHAAYA